MFLVKNETVSLLAFLNYKRGFLMLWVHDILNFSILVDSGVFCVRVPGWWAGIGVNVITGYQIAFDFRPLILGRNRGSEVSKMAKMDLSPYSLSNL